MPVRTHWTCYVGARWTRSLTWYASLAEYDADPSTAGKVNLTGYAAAMEVRSKEAAATAIVTLSTSTGEIVLGGAAGTIVLSLSPAQTATIAAQRAVFDLVLNDGTDDLEPLAEGTIDFLSTATLQ